MWSLRTAVVTSRIEKTAAPEFAPAAHDPTSNTTSALNVQEPPTEAAESDDVSAAVSTARPVATAPARPMENLIQDIARDMTSATPAWTAAKLKDVARRLGSRDIEDLRDRALDTDQPAGVRQTSVYLMTEAGPAAARALTSVAAEPLPATGPETPHSLGQLRANLERGLRIASLEALDAMAAADPTIRARLETILKTQKDPSLTFMVELSLAGIREGRPGKLGRFANRLLTEQENL